MRIFLFRAICSFVFYLSFVLLLFASLSEGADFSIMGGTGWDSGTWEKSPTGDHNATGSGYSLSAEGIFTSWKYKPTVRLSYREEKFDFATSQAPIQEAKAEIYSIHVGVTIERKYFNLSAMIGLDYIDYNAKLVEIVDGKLFPHAGTPDDFLPSGKICICKLYGDKVKVGPEIGAQIFFDTPGFERCRTFKMNPIYPYGWLRIQF